MSDRYRAVVTGGNTGIGAAISRTFLDRGYDVVCMSRRKPDFSHERLDFIEVDLADPAATRAAAAKAAVRPITHFVHNAGVIKPNLLHKVELEELALVTQLHLGAAIEIVQAALPSMKAAHFGRIVLMSSRALLGLQTRTVYSATKAGMIGMMRTWALELAQFGITVNAIAPGPIGDTEMFEAVMSPESERGKALAKAIPIGRLGRSMDVARAVDFFCAKDADFLTGQTLFVCGGASLGSTVT
ncbi:MAG: SDR family oxidoreductase [Hyphomicrobiales bacterium]|nr:SDR family oxidoreductase [Hyphomicrobiales bacterium]